MGILFPAGVYLGVPMVPETIMSLFSIIYILFFLLSFIPSLFCQSTLEAIIFSSIVPCISSSVSCPLQMCCLCFQQYIFLHVREAYSKLYVKNNHVTSSQ